MNEKLLYVDDDPNILRAYERSMRKFFQMDTALGGDEGLEAIRTKGPYAVVLSDMSMPGMNGIQFLAKVREHARDTVCIMLTGNADLQTAMQAVNEGNIFRFLTKPCPRETLVKALRAARKNRDVDAVVLRVDSGGGSGLASDIIWYETVKVAKEKPLIVSMGDVAASGGYYIAIEGEKIFVEPLTVTGSIGVVGMMPVIAELYDKIDATHETFKRGEHADQFSPMRKLTGEERDMADEVITWFYDDFVEKAAEARGMSEERLHELAQGRVYMGSQAIENGLVDERGWLAAAIDYACDKVGIAREDARVVYYRESRSFMDHLLGGAAAKLGLWKLLDFGDSGLQDLLRMEAITELPVD